MRRLYDLTDVPLPNDLSHKNEPETNLNIKVDTRMYPDMFNCYKQMAKIFGVDTDEIMLGNGFENVMKNVLLALKPKSLTWFKPSWGMLDVYCEALGIKANNEWFKYKNGIITSPLINYKTDVFYTTYNCNNLFKHENPKLPLIDSTYNIIDVSYLTLDEIIDVIDSARTKDIIVGSFDKLYGCGIRLGFAIFNKHLSKDMNVQREQYINLVAENILLNDLREPSHKWYDKVCKLSLPKGTMITHNFITIPLDYNGSLLHKSFNIGKQRFTRFGMPHNHKTYKELKGIL